MRLHHIFGSWCLALGMALGLGAQVAQADELSAAPPTNNPMARTAVVPIRGSIDNVTYESFKRRVELAKQNGAQTIIVLLDTPGGLVTASMDISRYIKNQTSLHTIAFVDSKAYSGGAMAALACDEIVMANGSAIGDCAPIMLDDDHRLQSLPATERAKIQSPILDEFRDSAARNHYDPRLLEAMVWVDHPVYWVQSPNDSAELRFVEKEEFDQLSKSGWKPVDGNRNPIVPANELLTVHPMMAQALGLSKGQASNVDDLARQRGLQIIDRFEPGAGVWLVDMLNAPVSRAVLLIIFIISLYVGLHAHGHGLAEAVAVISLGTLIGIPLMTGYAQWWQIVMVLAGLSFLALEFFVFPTSGAMAFVGVALMFLGFVCTFVGKEPGGGLVPKLPGTWTALEHGLLTVVISMGASGILCWWLGKSMTKVPLLRNLVLTNVSGGSVKQFPDTQVLPPANPWPPVGSVGKAVTDLLPGGRAAFYDDAAETSRIMSVVSETGFVSTGTTVEVRDVGMNRVVVRPVNSI